MDPLDTVAAEDDLRFPSGPWTGFYLQCWVPGRHTMTIELEFASGQLDAKGVDIVGPFTFRGDYDSTDGKCRWIKQYLGRHRVTYSGVNEGQGIWGVWEIRALAGLYVDRGVFHIWPQGMSPAKEADATVQAYLSHLRSRALFRLAKFAVCSALGYAAFLLVKHLAYAWTGVNVP